MIKVFGGIIFLLFGVYMIYNTYTDPASKGDSTMLNFRGYLWGVFSVVFGAVLICDYFSFW
jgi:hypothetical protein